MDKIDITPFQHLLMDLLNRDTDPGKIHICPLCNGRLHVSMSGYIQTSRGKRMGVGMDCEDCKRSVSFLVGTIPPWIKEAPEFEFTSLKDALEKLDKMQEE